MQPKSTIDNHREISAALDFLSQSSVADGVLELDPRVVSGWVEMSLGALAVLVKAKRGKHADDEALKQTVEEHLDHADTHMNSAYAAALGDLINGDHNGHATDDDGLMHFDHATARIALLYARKAIVEREKSEKPLIVSTVEQARDLFGDHCDMYYAAVGALQNRVTPVIAAKPADKFPSSCKVEKVASGTPIGCIWNSGGVVMSYAYRDGLHITPTRPVETENKPGKVESKCATPIKNWDVYVDGSKLTNCKLTSITTQDIDMPGNSRETVFGSSPITSTPVRGGGKLSFFSGTQPTKADHETAGNILCDSITIRNGESVGIATHTAFKDELVTVITQALAKCDVDRFARAGYINNIGLHNSPMSYVLCTGCSYAKWPNKGPGYSTRCDKCKLDPNRPGYVGK